MGWPTGQCPYTAARQRLPRSARGWRAGSPGSATPGRCAAWRSYVFVAIPGRSVVRWRHRADIEDELVAIRRVHGDRKTHGNLVSVESSPENLVYRDPVGR